MSENKPPVAKFKVGGCESAVWEQEGKNGSFLTVSSHRNYKDGEEWKKTNSLRANDIPCMTLALDKAFEYIKMHASKSEEVKGE